jgi:hypothetical protein
VIVFEIDKSQLVIQVMATKLDDQRENKILKELWRNKWNASKIKQTFFVCIKQFFSNDFGKPVPLIIKAIPLEKFL